MVWMVIDEWSLESATKGGNDKENGLTQLYCGLLCAILVCIVRSSSCLE